MMQFNITVLFNFEEFNLAFSALGVVVSFNEERSYNLHYTFKTETILMDIEINLYGNKKWVLRGAGVIIFIVLNHGSIIIYLLRIFL